MPIEDPIVDLSSLNENWPLDEEIQRDAAPPHMRLTKDAFKKAFTGLASGGGVVNASAAELNYLAGISGNVQTQLDQSDIPPRVVNTASVNANPTDKLLCDAPLTNMSIFLPEAPANGTEVLVQDVMGNAAAPDNRITVLASGSETITSLDSGNSGLSSVQFNRNSQYSIFVYFNTVWYKFNVSTANVVA